MKDKSFVLLVKNAEAQGEESNGIAPLLFVGMIIEGGIIGYDTNLKLVDAQEHLNRI